MENKGIKYIALNLLLVIIAACTSSCGVTIKMTDFIESFVVAAKNTSAAEVYFWQENNIETGTYREVNLLADIDADGKPLTCEEDKYRNYRLHLFGTRGQKETSRCVRRGINQQRRFSNQKRLLYR